MDNESRKWLYKNLRMNGYNVGNTQEEFDKLMDTNEESRKWAYDRAQELGYNVGKDYNEFTSLVGPEKPAQANTEQTAAQAGEAPRQDAAKPTWQQSMAYQMQAGDIARSTQQSMQDFNTRMENIRKGNTLGKTSDYSFNPESGKMEQRYYTTQGDEVTTPTEQSRLNLRYRDEWEATTEEGRKHREERMQNDYEGAVNAALAKFDPDNAALQVWQQAEDRTRAEMDKHNAEITDKYAGFGGREMRMSQTFETVQSNMADRLKQHDLQKMADEAWNMLGTERQQAITDDIAAALKNRYPQAADEQIQQAAREMAREQSDRRMYAVAIEKNAPKSATEYFLRKAIGGNALMKINEAFARKQAGTTGDWEAREIAEQQYEKQGHKVAGIAGTVTGFALDPLTWASAGVGGSAVKGSMWLGGKLLGQAATRKFGSTLAGRMIAGAIGGGANFATFEAGGEALDQTKWGSYIDEETGERKEGFSWGNVGRRAGHGALMGSITGTIAPFLGNVSDKLVKATESTAGKLAVRTGELGVGTLAEGTIFAVPELVQKAEEYNNYIDSLSDETSPNYIADEQQRAAKIEELRNQRGEAMQDVWTDNMAMIAGFKAQHLLKSAPARIAEYQRLGKGKAGFETRIRMMLDGTRPELALTDDEKKELEGKYDDLKELTEEYKRYAEAKEEYDKAHPNTTDAGRMIGSDAEPDIPYNRFTELMNDGSISEAARAKMYYYLTGNVLPMSTVMFSDVKENKDAEGNIKGYTVQSIGANGVITSRTFDSKKRAEVEVNRINRQAELNGFDVGERSYDNKGDNRRMYEACQTVAEEVGAPANLLFELMKEKTETMDEVELQWVEKIVRAYEGLGDKYGSSEIRAEVNEKYGVDVDKAIGKERNRRSDKEQAAVEEYGKLLFADAKQKQEEAKGRGEAPVDPNAPTTGSQAVALLGLDEEAPGESTESAAFKRGQKADTQERQDIAIELAETGSQEAQDAWNGVVQRINEDAEYMAAQARERNKELRHADGSLRPAVLKEKDSEGNNQIVYIIEGNVQMTPDGSMVDKAASDNIVVIYNPATGERKQIDPTSDTGITYLGPSSSPEQQEADIERRKQEYIQEMIDDAQGTVRFAPGQQLILPTGEEAVVVAIDGAGENITVALADGTQATVQRSKLQRIRDEKARADYRQRHNITDEPQAQQPEAAQAQPQQQQPAANVVSGAPAEYAEGMEITIRDDEDGVEKPAMVMGLVRYENGQFVPDANGGIVEYLMDGEVRHDHLDKIGEKVVNYVIPGQPEPAAEAPAAPVAGNGPTTEPQRNENGVTAEAEQPTAPAEPQPAQAELAAPAAEPSDAMPMTGTGEDAEPDFKATTPQRGHRYIYDEAGLSREEANQFVSNNIEAANKTLDKVKGKAPKMGTSIAKFNKDKAAWQQQVSEAQNAVDYWNGVKAEQDNIVSQEIAAQRERDAAAHDAAVLAEQQRQAEELARQQEQAERGANAVQPAIREKWEAAPKIEGAENEITLANGERVKGRYVLVESGAATPSHNPNMEFAPSEGFPVDENGQTVNDRDYERDKDAQDITRSMGASYDSRAIQETPIVSNDGVVLSGNGRTMAGELAAQNNTDGAYIEHLQKYPQQFGFTSEQVQGMQHPRVLFVPDEAMPYTTETFAKFNQQGMKSQSRTEQSVKLGKTVDDAIFGRIIQSINAFDSLNDFYNDPEAATNAIDKLRDAGVISSMQYAEMFDGEKVSGTGRQILENMLIGKAFESNPDAIRQLGEYPAMRQSVISALAEISNNIKLGEDYSVENELASAIDLAYQARKSGSKSGEPVSWFARQLNLFPFEHGETVADYTNATVLMLADQLNSSKVNGLKNILAIYNNAAIDAANGQLDIFNGGVKTKQDIINDALNVLDYGTESEQKAALNAAREERKAAATAGQAGGSEGVQQNGANDVGEPGDDARGNAEAQHGVRDADLVGRNYTLSEQVADNGEHFYQDENGNIDLVDIPQEVFDAIDYKKAPLRLTPSMILHMIDRHGKETGADDVDKAIAFILDVMNNFDHVRLGYNGALIFSIENDRKKTGKRAISILLSSKTGDFYGIVSSGYEGVEKLKKRPELWAGSAIITPATDSATELVTTLDARQGGGQIGSASSHSNGSSNEGLQTESEKENSRQKPEVYTRPALEPGTNTDSSGVNSGQTEGVTAPAGNSPQTSEGKVMNKSANVQTNAEIPAPESGNTGKVQGGLGKSVIYTGDFKKWFGDWENDHENASKVVDENGEPMVMYHGSSVKAKDINVFDMRDGSMGKGAYFTSSYEEACDYAKQALAGTEGFPKNAEDISDEDVEQYVGEYYLNVRDSKNITHSRFDRDAIEVITTSPEQIKSATDDYMERSRQYDALKKAEAETNTEPTEAQKEAGNYKKGHVRIDGYDVTIENPKGSERSGTDASGKKWSITMNNTYGYIRGTEGVDGDHIDVFFSDDPSQGDVFVVDQVNADGSFDEHKVMYGFPDIESARKAYLSNYEEGWQGLGAITHVSKEEFKKWIDSSHRKTKPFADYASVKAVEGQSGEPQPYAIAPTTYTNKKGKTTPMHLVTFGRELSKEELRAGKELARESRGWWDSKQGGFMMRDEESAKALAEALGNEEAVQDAQPLSAKDMAAVSDQAEVKAVDEAIKVEQEPQTTPQYDYDREENVLDTVLAGLRDALNNRTPGSIPNINAIEKEIRDLRKRIKAIEDGMPTAAGETVPQAFAQLADLNGRRRAYERFLGDLRRKMEEDRRDEALAAHGVKLGDKVIIRGKEATIHDADERQVTLDTGLAPVMYEVADWEDVEIPKPEKEYHGGDRVFSLKHNANKDIFSAHHAGGKVEYTFTDGTKASADEVQDALPMEQEAPKAVQPFKTEKEAKDYLVSIGYDRDSQYMNNPKNEAQDYIDEANYQREQRARQEEPKAEEQPKQEEKKEQKAKSKWVNEEDQERFEKLQQRLRKKIWGQLNVGVDPEILAIGVEMSYLMLKHGARKFNEFAKNLIEALGEEVRPYIKAFYNGARDLPEMAEYEKDMTPYEEVRQFDVMNFDKKGAKDIVATAEHVAREQVVEREAKEATDKLKQERNEERKENEQQVAADTEAIASEAAAVAGEVESKLPSAGNEQEVNDLAKSVDDAIDKVNEQLAVLGYYEAEYADRAAERYKGELQQVEARDGKPFEYADELKQAKEKLAEYEELMKAEMAEKEAKYAEMDASVEAAKGVQLSDEDSDDVTEDTAKYRIREDEPPTKTGIGYKVFVLKDGKLYPPMVANPNGEATPVGVWLDADAAPVAGVTKTGRQQVKAGGKGTQGGSGKLAYRPGWHLGEIPYALQFNRMNPETGQRELFPANFVWAEVEYANDVDYQEEAMSYGMNASGKFQHSLAGLPRLPENGSYRYRTNPDPNTDPWVITGAMKVNRILKPSEVDAMVEAAGREPQQRQAGAITDEQVEALNANVKRTMQEDRDMMRSAVQQMGEKLHTNINIIEDVNEITHPNAAVQERRRKSKGWYDTATGQVNIVLDNNRDIDDVKASVGHETIAHKGLRELVGEENYGEFLDETYRHLRDDLKKGVDEAAGRAFVDDTTNNGERAKSYEEHRRTATDELFGRMAEKPFEEFSEGERTLWQRIKATVRRLLDKFLGTLKLPKWFEIGDNELRYMLWRSKERMERGKEDPIDLARDIVKREELGLNDDAVYTMSDSSESFAKLQKRAVKQKGIVMPRLSEKEIKIVDVPKHGFEGTGKEVLKSAEKWAKENIVGTHTARDSEDKVFEYRIGNKSVEKYVSSSSLKNSDNIGVHISVLKKLPEVISNSIEAEVHPDYTKNDEGVRNANSPINNQSLIHRFYGAVTIDGNVYRVKTTIREYADKNWLSKAHNYEVTKIELLEAPSTSGIKTSGEPVAMTSNNSISGAKLLKDVEKEYDKGVKLLAQNANSQEVQGGVGKISDESTDLYRDGDETGDIWSDQSMSLQERMTAAAIRLANNHSDNKTLRNDAMRAIGGNLADLRRAMSLQRTFDMTTVKRVADLVRVLMDGGYLNGLSQQEVKRLLAAVKNSVGKNDIERDVQKVMDIMIDNQLKHAEAALQQLEAIRGSKVDARGVEVQGQLDPAGAHIMKVFKKTRGMEKTDIEEALADAQQRMGSSDAAVADEAALDYTGLQLAKEYAENIKDSKVEERNLREEMKQAHDEASERDRDAESYRQYIASVQEAIRQNKIERAESYANLAGKLTGSLRGSIENAKAFKEAEKQRIREIQHNANSDMQGRASDEHYKPKFMDKFVNNSFVSYVFAPLATFDQMLRMFGGKSANGEGYLYNRFMRGWVDAREKEIKGVREKYAILDAKAAELFGGKVKTWGNLIRRVGKLPKATVSFWNGGEMQEHELTQGNLMYIYMVDKMLDGRMKLRRMGITEEDIEDIENALDPRLIQLADWLQDEFLVDTRNEYNKTHKRMFGASMSAIEHYFPLKILANARADKPEDLDNPDKGDGISTATGSIIKRRRNSLALDITGADALSVILDHVAQMEHWNAYAEFNRDLNTLRTYRRFRNQVQNMTTIYGSGKELWRKFNDVCQMAAGTYRPPRTKLDEAAVNFAKGVTAAKVSFRVFTALKQFLSWPAFIPETRPDYLLANLANPVKAWKWSMENMPIFDERWRSRMAGDPRLLKSDMDWKMWRTHIVQLASRVGMAPNAFVDALTISIGAHSIYQTRKARYLREGYNEEQAEHNAIQDAETLYNETQQSSEGAFTSTMQVDRSWLSVMFTVFRNASMSYTRQLYDALRNLKHNLTPGGRARSIEFMTKQLLREWNASVDGEGNWSAEDTARAEKAAKSRFNRQLLKDTLRVATFGYIMQLAWNLGAYLPYLLFGDDDDEKQKMWDDVWAHTMFGSVEGLTGGDVMSDAGRMLVTGEGNPAYLSKDMPLTSDFTEMLKKLGSGKHTEALNDITNLVVQSGIGVNPQSITDGVLAIMDACGDDPELAHEASICVMRILQMPQSQIDKIYFDEVGLSGKEVSKYTPAQLAERYARFKVKRSNFFAPWAWDDEKSMEKFTKKADKTIKERTAKMGDAGVNDTYLQYEEVYKGIDERVKAAKKMAETDYLRAAQMMASAQDSKDFTIYEEFKAMDGNLDKFAKGYLASKTPEEAALYRETMLRYKSAMVEVLDASTQEERKAALGTLSEVMEDFSKRYKSLVTQ